MNKRRTPGKWRVEADAEKEGKHPFHSFRHVTSYDPAQGGKVTICDMRDSSHMKVDAGLIFMAPLIPDLHNALNDMSSGFHIETQTDQVRYRQVRALLKESQRRLAEITDG
jgi:hypothetical protein